MAELILEDVGAGSLFLTIDKICQYLGATPNSRNFVEGEAILNSKHIVLCEATAKHEDKINVFALALQGSGVSLAPHEVKGVLLTQNNGEIREMKCSCKAGSSNKCKHVAAVLLYCSRNDAHSFRILSQTDIKCAWNMKKGPVLEQYGPKPFLETNCFRNRILQTPLLSMQQKNNALSTLLAACPNSALALHRNGRRNNIGSQSSEICSEEKEKMTGMESQKVRTLKKLIDEEHNFWMGYVALLEFVPLHECCKDTYEKQIICTDALRVSLVTERDKNQWEQERKFRITGSRCYGIYTYGRNNPDWAKKSTSYFWPKKYQKPIKNFVYGTAFEEPAREQYKKMKKADVLQTGLIFSNKNPWLGFPPDGLVMENDEIVKLLEIKCPTKGADMTILEAVKDATYLKFENGQYQLKERHQYYGQVQLGMAMLNVEKTDFVLYSSKDNSLLITEVPVNEQFLREMLLQLKKKYFKYMLHNLCVNSKVM